MHILKYEDSEEIFIDHLLKQVRNFFEYRNKEFMNLKKILLNIPKMYLKIIFKLSIFFSLIIN